MSLNNLKTITTQPSGWKIVTHKTGAKKGWEPLTTVQVQISTVPTSSFIATTLSCLQHLMQDKKHSI